MFRLVINNDRSYPFQGSFEELERHAEKMMCVPGTTRVDIWFEADEKNILVGTLESLVEEKVVEEKVVEEKVVEEKAFANAAA